MLDTLRSASQDGHQHVYHYQDFQAGTHAKRLIDILKNQRIYCSNPTSFNDPWDCKPYFDVEGLEDPNQHAATAEFFIKTRIPGPLSDAFDRALRTDRAAIKGAVHKFGEYMRAFMPTKWGVYCVSPDPCITLMWSHYSRNHQGICLEFQTQSKFGGAQKVDYAKEYPRMILAEEEVRRQMLLSKSDVWSYEQEYRLICPRSTDVKESPYLMDGNYLRLNKGDLTTIIFGCQATKETTRQVRALVQKHAPEVTIGYARRAPNKYRLVIEDSPE